MERRIDVTNPPLLTIQDGELVVSSQAPMGLEELQRYIEAERKAIRDAFFIDLHTLLSGRGRLAES